MSTFDSLPKGIRDFCDVFFVADLKSWVPKSSKATEIRIAEDFTECTFHFRRGPTKFTDPIMKPGDFMVIDGDDRVCMRCATWRKIISEEDALEAGAKLLRLRGVIDVSSGGSG